MLSFRFLVLLMFLLFTSVGHSFINIESLRQTNEIGHLGSLSFRLSGEIGNAEKVAGQVSLLDGYLTESREIIIIADYGYGQSLGLKSKNDGRLHLRHTKKYEQFPDVELFAQTQFNEFTRLTMRTLVGSGLRFELFNDDSNFFYLGTGFFYEKLVREDSPNKNGVRANLYASYLYRIQKKFETSITIYYQPYLDKPSDFWLNLNFGIDYSISNRLSLSHQVRLTRDSDPPDNIKTTDISYFAGLTFGY